MIRLGVTHCGLVSPYHVHSNPEKKHLKKRQKPSAAESFELLAPASYLQGAESGLSQAQSLKRVQLVGLGEVNQMIDHLQ